MKRIYFTLAAAVLTATVSSAATRLIKVPVEVKGISTETTLNVTVKQSDAPAKVTVTGPDKAIVNEINATVTGANLRIHTTHKPVKGTNYGERYKNITIVYEGALPSDYQASSSGKIKVVNPLSKDGDVNISVSSSGDVEIPSVSCSTLRLAGSSSGDIDIVNVSTKAINIGASSSADVEISNVKCTELNMSVSSSADIDIKNLVADNTNASVSSSAKVEIDNVIGKSLNLNASSSSEVDIDKCSVTSVTAISSSNDSPFFSLSSSHWWCCRGPSPCPCCAAPFTMPTSGPCTWRTGA